MAPSVAPTEFMVVALLPLWGALLGCLGATAIPVYVIVLLWIVLTRVEQRLLHLSNAYLLVSVVAGLAWLRFPPAFETAVASHAAARAAMIALAWVARPAASGQPLAVSSWAAAVAIGTTVAVVFAALDYRRAIAICAGAYLVVRLVREFVYRRSGGIDSTALAATKGLTELMAVLVCSLL